MRGPGRFLICIAAALSGVSAWGAEVRLQPVRASGPHTIVGSEIRLGSAGQRVFLEIKIKGFAPDFLRAYQMNVNSAGYGSCPGGTLTPAVQPCPSANAAGNAFCQTAFGDTGVGSSRCVDVDSGPATVLRCEPLWINQSRTDWIFFDYESLVAVDDSGLDYKWGALLIMTEAIVDDGSVFYAGGLALDVPWNAVGTFTIGFISESTFLVKPDAGASLITPLSLTAAKITILCSNDGQCDDGNACTTDHCNTQTRECVNIPHEESLLCDDCDACTIGDLCVLGVCVPGELMICANGGECRTSGTCNPDTGLCAPPVPKPDGTLCNVCSTGGHCEQGVCVSGPPEFVGGGGSGRTAVVCDPETGLCSPPMPRADGDSCDDGNPCTLNDYCAQTTCMPGPLLVCPSGDQCNSAGACNPDTGQCTPPAPKPNGTDCDDGNACTQGDRCQQGVCAPGASTVCPGGSPCINSGTCNPQTGLCSPRMPKPDGTACDDGDACTLNDVCEGGECAGTGVPNCLRWHEFVPCLEGPDVPVEPVCVDFDLNRDGYVDLTDVAEFMLLPGQP